MVCVSPNAVKVMYESPSPDEGAANVNVTATPAATGNDQHFRTPGSKSPPSVGYVSSLPLMLPLMPLMYGQPREEEGAGVGGAVVVLGSGAVATAAQLIPKRRSGRSADIGAVRAGV